MTGKDDEFCQRFSCGVIVPIVVLIAGISLSATATGYGPALCTIIDSESDVAECKCSNGEYFD